ncbi:hypothetical protein ACP4OV_012161 [Aristida adscensionis]
MASAKQLLLALAVVVVLASPAALAVDHLVGDDNDGWRLGVDYAKWVDGNEFIVGDTLVFKYAKGNHTVVETTAASFAACSQANSVAAWSSGEDRVALNASGQRWFICGEGDHCLQGMKLNVTVLPAVKFDSPEPHSPPAPPPSAAAVGSVASALAAGAVAAAAAAALLFDLDLAFVHL